MLMMMVLKNLAKFATQMGAQSNNTKRFYKESIFTANPAKKHPLHNFLITLDGKTITTPYRNTLAVPTAALGFMVAAEFNRQQKYLKTGQMPMLALCRTAVDADIQGHLAHHLKHSIYEYLKTDTLLYIDETLQKDHQKLSKPLIQNFSKRFGIQLKLSQSIMTPDVQINDTFINWVDSLNNWQLIGLQTMTIWMKSAIAAYSVIGSDKTIEDIQAAAYLQQTTQMRVNGEVEEKIMDINQIRLMISCGQMMFKYSKSQVI